MTGSPLTPLEQRIVRQLAQLAQRQPAATRVWVFGSRARGDSHEESDLDLAVEFGTAETAELRAWLDGVRRELEEPLLGQHSGFIDLLGLYAGDPDHRLAQQVRAEGRVIWQRGAAVAA